jgi:hypothetical protein
VREDIIRKDEDLIRKEIEEFEEGFPDGVYVIPRDPKSPRVKVRALHDYCKEKGITPEDLTAEEMEQFLERQ